MASFACLVGAGSFGVFFLNRDREKEFLGIEFESSNKAYRCLILTEFLLAVLVKTNSLGHF